MSAPQLPSHGELYEKVALRSFRAPHRSDDDEFSQVAAVATRLHAHLNSAPALARIEAANRPKASSAEVQGAFREFVVDLGFECESKGMFADYESALRPDYYLRIGSTGVLLEVERGKTTINNMDLLDFWKCHLCPYAHYLFLVVPRALRQNPEMKPRNEFELVTRRLKTFFTPRNVTNVRGLFIFGY